MLWNETKTERAGDTGRNCKHGASFLPDCVSTLLRNAAMRSNIFACVHKPNLTEAHQMGVELQFHSPEVFSCYLLLPTRKEICVENMVNACELKNSGIKESHLCI